MIYQIALQADLAEIEFCARAAYARYVPVIGREPAPMVADFASRIERKEVWVAKADSVFGYIVFFPQEDVMFLENVAVLPERAGTGIGRHLIDLCETEASNLGLDRVCLYTNAAMTQNLSLYPRLGYHETGRRTEDGFRRVYFEKRL